MAIGEGHDLGRTLSAGLRAAVLGATLLCGCSGGGGGAEGGVTVLSATSCPSGTGALLGTTCQLLQVDAGSLPSIEVEIRVFEADPGATYLGTVVACSGGNGTLFTEELGNGDQMIADLVLEGFRVVDRRWVTSWLLPGPSIREASERFAVLARWIKQNLHTGGAFAALGNSGGSSEIGYGLTTWQLGSVLDQALLTSGPGLARIDYQCLPPTSAWAAQCPSSVPAGQMECWPPQCTAGNEPICSGIGNQTAAEMHADSVLHPAAELSFPGTLVHVLIGAQDCGTSTPQAVLFEESLLGPSTIQYVPNTPHGFYASPQGRLAVIAALLGSAPQPAGSAPGMAGLQLSVIEGEQQSTFSGTLPLRR